MNKIFKIRAAGILILLAMLAVCGLGVMLLWNALIPGIFGLPALNYPQAAGLLLLSWILFGGFGPGPFMTHVRQGRDERLFRHGNPLREKWMNMTKEERRAFIEKEQAFMCFHRGFSRFHDFFDGDREKPDANGKDAPGNSGNEGKNKD